MDDIGNAKGRPPGTFRSIALNYDKYLMMLPYLVLFFIFTILPVLSSLVLSFTDFNLLNMPNFVGWSNYAKLFLEDDIFLRSVRNTLLFALVTGPISFALCLFVAWLVNDLPPKVRALMTLLFYAPSLSGNVFLLWRYIFNNDMYGWVNGTLMNLGILTEPIKWLSDGQYALTVVIIVQLWLALGTSFLAFIAGMQGINRSLYEQGSIDGIRNRWQELFYITLPSMGPQLLFGAVMQIAASFAAGRIVISLIGDPANTDYQASTVITHIIDYGTVRFEMGYASAIATVLFVAMVLTNKLIRRLLQRYQP